VGHRKVGEEGIVSLQFVNQLVKGNYLSIEEEWLTTLAGPDLLENYW